MLNRRRLAATVVASTTALTLVGLTAPAQASTPKCYGKKATIVLSKSNKSVKGTKKNDVIVVTGKNDSVDGKGGKDLICGKDVKKVVLGKGGPNKVQIASGTVSGGDGNDAIEIKGVSTKPATLSGGGGTNSYKVPATALKRVTIKPGVLGDTLNGQPVDLGLPTTGPEAYLSVSGNDGETVSPATARRVLRNPDDLFDTSSSSLLTDYYGDSYVAIQIGGVRAPAGSAVASWSFDAGDGSAVRTGTGVPPTYIDVPYISAGTHVAALTLTDTQGRSSVTRLPIALAPPSKPVLTVVPFSAAGPVSFTLSATTPPGVTITQWMLDYGDGSEPLTGTTTPIPATASHTYNNGSYYAYLHVRDSNNDTETSYAYLNYSYGPAGSLTVAPSQSTNDTIPGSPLALVGSAARTVPVRRTLDLSLRADTGSFDVDWGDGTVDRNAGSEPDHTYDVVGPRTVTVTNRSGSTVLKTATLAVTVVPASVLVSTAVPSVIPQGPLTIPITTTRMPAGSSWAIYFSDGTDELVGKGPLPASVTHTFSAQATHLYEIGALQSVEVDVEGSDGQYGGSFSELTVTSPFPSIPSVGFGQGRGEQYQGWSALVAGHAGYAAADFAPGAGHRIASVGVDFGDGTTIASVPGVGAGSLPATETGHTYTTPGDRTLTATVRDSKGLARSASATVSVVGAPTLTTPATGAATTTAAFTLPVTAAPGTGDAILGWTVYWSDGSATAYQSGLGAPPATLTHTFPAGGPYGVRVTVVTQHGVGITSTTTVTVS